MATRTLPALILVFSSGLAGCNGSSSPTAPSVTAASAVPQQPAPSAPAGLWGVTLFGVVSEVTAAGETPVEGVWVYCDACGKVGHTSAYTDANGYYSFTGDLDHDGGIWVNPGVPTLILVGKEGFQDPPGLPRSPRMPSGPGWREVTISGDTRFDITLVQR
jgi:hypothetical protein